MEGWRVKLIRTPRPVLASATASVKNIRKKVEGGNLGLIMSRKKERRVRASRERRLSRGWAEIIKIFNEIVKALSQINGRIARVCVIESRSRRANRAKLIFCVQHL